MLGKLRGGVLNSESKLLGRNDRLEDEERVGVI